MPPQAYTKSELRLGAVLPMPAPVNDTWPAGLGEAPDNDESCCFCGGYLAQSGECRVCGPEMKLNHGFRRDGRA